MKGILHIRHQFLSFCTFSFQFGYSFMQVCTGIKSCMKTGTVRKILSSGAKMKFSLHFLRLLCSSFEIWYERSAVFCILYAFFWVITRRLEFQNTRSVPSS